MSKIDAAIIIQARMASTRLPGKTMLPLAGFRMLYHVVNRLKQAPVSGPVIVATSDKAVDDFICSFTGTTGVGCYRGSEEDVLARFWGAAEPLSVKYIVRATADNPLVWEGAVEHLGELAEESGSDYMSFNKQMPLGLGLELFTREALCSAWQEAVDPKQREHVTPYIYTNRRKFKCKWAASPKELKGNFRLTVDTEEDYELMKIIFDRLYQPSEILPSSAAVALLRNDPDLAGINADIRQKRFDE